MQPSLIPSSPQYLRFRESHHAVARWFAMGFTISKISQLTGYTRRRLGLLWADPTFQELVVSYANHQDSEWRADIDHFNVMQRQSMLVAESQVLERLERAEETGEDLPLMMLDRISQSRADRLGYSKHSKQTIEHTFADKLDAAIERSNKAKLIEARPTSASVIEATQPVDAVASVESRIEAQPVGVRAIEAPQPPAAALAAEPRPLRRRLK